MTEYNLNQGVEVSLTIVDRDGAPVTPTTLVLTFTKPDGTTLQYEYGVDAELTNPDVGEFLVTEVHADVAGRWRVTAESTEPRGATSGEFYVKRSTT